ncbi:MAG: YihY family inner membrane protein [Lentisphaerae bacterium]|nr:YihY family inner membrane protein [Lentisphaerota bacterium]
MSLASVRGALAKAGRFLTGGAWDIEVTSLPKMKSFGVKSVRVVHLVLRGFRDDECPLHASALTFNTLMAIVPLLALSLAVARGLGGAEAAKDKIRHGVYEWTQRFETQEQVEPSALTPPGPAQASVEGEELAEDAVVEDPPPDLAAEINGLVETGFEKVENINFAGLNALGVALLFWMAISVLGRVESSFNRVWGVSSGRSLLRRFADYLSVILILPILALAASSLPVVDFATRFLSEPQAETIRTLMGSGTVKNIMVLLMTTLSFAFLIMFMPNTRVKAKAGLAGGFVTALLFLGWMWLCAAIQVGAARAGKIYGSFAVVPILLTWVYMSWQIILFGAETAFAIQNCGTYRMETGARSASPQSRIPLALSIASEAGRAMLGQADPFSIAEYAVRKQVPVRFLNSIVADLVQADMMGELAGHSGQYVLLRSPDTLKVTDIIRTVVRAGVQPGALGLGTADPAIVETLRKTEEGIARSLDEGTVQDLLTEGSVGSDC